MAERCPDCGKGVDEEHDDGCDIERCTVCGDQFMCCGCEGHDKQQARWTGDFPEVVWLCVRCMTWHEPGRYACKQA